MRGFEASSKSKDRGRAMRLPAQREEAGLASTDSRDFAQARKERKKMHIYTHMHARKSFVFQRPHNNGCVNMLGYRRPELQ